MADVDGLYGRAEALLADLGALLRRARDTEGAARQRALAAATLTHIELGRALAEEHEIFAATRLALRERRESPQASLH